MFVRVDIIDLDHCLKGFAEKVMSRSQNFCFRDFAIFQFSIEILIFLRPFYAKIGDWVVVVHISRNCGFKGNFLRGNGQKTGNLEYSQMIMLFIVLLEGALA